jgi:hypothetical protein
MKEDGEAGFHTNSTRLQLIGGRGRKSEREGH